jgi:uncharacterized protein (DUF885 family)
MTTDGCVAIALKQRVAARRLYLQVHMTKLRKNALVCTLASCLSVMPAIARDSVVSQQSAAASLSSAPGEDNSWIASSNVFTKQLLDVQLEHNPEEGSHEGVAKFDLMIANPTSADRAAERRELESALVVIKKELAKETDENVQNDLSIILKAFNLQFRREDYELQHDVPFLNASEIVFRGLRVLLDDQVSAARRPAAVTRLKKYAGVVPGYKPFTDLLKQRVLEQTLKPGAIYPSRGEVETELGRNSNYIDGIGALFAKYDLTGWQMAFARLKTELADYDTWVRAKILPQSRTDFRLQPEAYALALEGYGVDLKPGAIASLAHAAFLQYQAEMAPLAAAIAGTHGFPSADYRSVITQLKRRQIVGDAILPFYESRLREIENIIIDKNIVALPDRPAVIRLATAAETAEEPAPHMSPPPILHNTGQRGEFVLPLNIPGAGGVAGDQYDDFTLDPIAWAIIAHEARPGHELQFDSMVEHGVSLARALYAANSANVEGWGLYSEYLMQPYEPPEGQLMTLQLRLLRAARAFIDPELQSGVMTIEDAYAVLEHDVVISPAFAKEEVERFSYRAPGQATSYFYGYTRLLDLRREVETTLGAGFDQRQFHDFILKQGLLPPDLMRSVVLKGFIGPQPGAG